jgi:molybdopterin converting factor subunit 1
MKVEGQDLKVERRRTKVEGRRTKVEEKVAATKKVKVQYFAIFREQSGLSSEEIETETRTAAELFRELSARHGFSLRTEHIKVSINLEIVNIETPIENGDSVVFIPPVAGG